MVKKCTIWLSMIFMCMLPANAAAKLIGACWDYTNSPVVEINPADGSVRTIGSSGFAHLNSLAKDDAGRLFSVGGAGKDQLIRINPSTGQGTLVATLNFGADPVDVRGLAFSPTGILYAINCRPGSGIQPHDLFSINLITGVGTKINSTALGGVQSITFGPFGFLWGWDVDLGLVIINTATGAVIDVNPAIGGTYGIQGITFAPDGTLYGAGCIVSENDKLYTINAATGAYTLVGTAAGVFQVRGIEYGPDIVPSTIIGTCFSFDNSKVVAINPANGGISTIGLSGFAHLNSLVKDGEGKLYAVGGASKNQLIRINPVNGQGTLVVTLNFGSTPVDVRGLAFSPSGVLYAINCRPGAGLPPHDLYQINMATGVGTRINPELTPLPKVQSITFSPGGLLYGWDVDTYGLILIIPASGNFMDINPAIAGFAGIQGIAFAPDGTLYGSGRLVGENDKLYIIDKTTGAHSLVGTAANVYDVRGIEFIPSLRRLPSFHLLLLD